MKNIFVMALLLLTSQLITAQENTYYLTSEYNIGNYLGVDLNLNYVFKNKYALKVGFSGNIRKPKSQPDNYSSGLNGLFSFTTANPYDHFLNYKIDFGRIYALNKKGTIRANIAFGLGYTVIKEPTNWQSVESDSWVNLAENYTYTYYSYSTMSLTINPKIEFPLTRFFGFSVSPMIQLNKDRTYFGIGIGTMFGKLK
ncbi:hypothetical protein FIA58_018995 [Flavobacterium jejuense]|uniref:Outer membrane protein beta-barrel domain-containing protein n=1 Tax=Flavobacterium jejuense TaxID=1544455 RepID=A0ABX0IV71_9FLAO|nr:hypothetical protein [Flavobacterium jejuense]NHN27772.1 hypothetical protein [Flavobacterium jejuense]